MALVAASSGSLRLSIGVFQRWIHVGFLLIK